MPKNIWLKYIIFTPNLKLFCVSALIIYNAPLLEQMEKKNRITTKQDVVVCYSSPVSGIYLPKSFYLDFSLVSGIHKRVGRLD